MNGSIIRELVSVVVPVFNEVESLKELYRQISNTFKDVSFNYEVIFIDDGSNDGSVEIEETIAKSNKNVTVLQFQRNYGKAAALSEGFKYARGEFVATLDADLQDDPKEIPVMIEQLGSKFDLISGWKKKRRDPITKRIPSKVFNKVTSLMTGVRIHDFNCGLKVYRNEVAKSLNIYGGLYRYIPALASLAGYKVGEKKVLHRPREYGVSKYGRSRLYRGFWDLITVLFLGKYTRRPLHLFGFLGIICFLGGFIILIYLTIGWLQGIWIGNRPIFFLGILLLIVGLQFTSMGLLAEMIAFGQKKEHYIVRKIAKSDSNN
ncbi:MAG: glycosyltransferase family 2 protein [Candidatus Marinimicrobia bacterium]|nr:glycosyltransferase family 2 protein [Candidatus Neomarinimicrobiota bacterium]